MTPAEYIRRKSIYPVALTTEQVDALSQEFREASAWIVGQNEAYIIAAYYRAAAKLAEGKLSATEARRLVRETLRAAGYQGASSLAEGSLSTPTQGPKKWIPLGYGTARQRLILETNVNKAAGYAWHESVRGDVGNPAQELVRFENAREPRDWKTRWRNAWAGLPASEKRKALPDRMIALTDCAIWRALSRWGDPYPPFDYNSGMDVVPVDYETAVSLGLLREGEEPERGESAGFGYKRELPAGEPSVNADIEAWIKEALQ